MEILRYVLADRSGTDLDHEYESYEEAQGDAQERGFAVVQRTYEYADSELVWTPDGSSVWPSDWNEPRKA